MKGKNVNDWEDAIDRLWPIVERNTPQRDPRGRPSPVTDRVIFTEMIDVILDDQSWDAARKRHGISEYTMRRRFQLWSYSNLWNVIYLETRAWPVNSTARNLANTLRYAALNRFEKMQEHHMRAKKVSN